MHTPSCCCLHHHLPFPFSESIREICLVVCTKDIIEEGLSTVFVYPLGDLVARGVAEAGEEGEELAAEGGGRVVLEDDRRERGRGDLCAERR